MKMKLRNREHGGEKNDQEENKDVTDGGLAEEKDDQDERWERKK